MTDAHLHLLLNHFPIVGTMLGTVILALALLRKGDRGVWLAGTVLLAISAASAGAANLTGEPAEEQIEHMPGVNEDALHEHEERAEAATIVSVVVGIGAVAAYFVGRNRGGVLGIAIPLGAAFISSGLLAWTGAAGGEIRHPEVVSGATGEQPSGARGQAGEGGEAGELGER